MKDIHIGHEIQKRVEELRMTKTDFARRIGMAQQNVNRIFEGRYISTDKLLNISRILEFDFFALYLDDKKENNAVAIGENPIAAINSEVQTSDCAVLQERVHHLEQLLMEKERMIQYLLRDVQRDIKT